MFQNGIKDWGLLVLRRLMGGLLFVIVVAVSVWLWVAKPSTPAWSKFLTNWISSAAFSPDGMLLAVGDDKGNVTIFKKPNQDPSKIITLSADPTIRITALCFHSDCNTLFAGGSDGNIRIWNVGTEKMEAKLSGHSDAVCSLAVSKDGKCLFSESAADPILCWSIPEKKVINTIKTDQPSIGTPRFALSPSGNTFATAALLEKAPTLWNFGAKESTKVRTFLPASDDNLFFCLSFSPDGKKLATATWRAEVTVWDVATGKSEFSFRDTGPGPVVSVAFSQDSNLVAAVQSATTVFFCYPKLKIWSLVSGNECASVSCTLSGFDVVAFSPDGQGLVTGSGDGWVRYWLLEELIR